MACRLTRSLNTLPSQVALAVGTFDGVHLGHQALLNAMIDFSASHNRCASVLTFSAPPNGFLHPASDPGRLMDNCSLVHTLRGMISNGLLIQQTFNAAFASIPAPVFAASLQHAVIFCGEDWRFGMGAEGSPRLLQALGFDVHIIPYAQWQGTRISSSRIRSALRQGKFDEAAAMLGRPWQFSGRVEHGRGLAGTLFGVPTLNIPYHGRSDERMAPLAHGVYLANARVQRLNTSTPTYWPALVNFGTAPSIKQIHSPLFEVHLIGASGDFYDAQVELSFNTPRLRPEQHFSSLVELKQQILKDLAIAQEWFTAHGH